MTAEATFLWGLFGSVGVEAVTLLAVYEHSGDRLPDRYYRLGFYAVRTLVALMAGSLAVAYDVQSPILAVHVGAATPLILHTLAQALPPGGGPSGGTTRPA